MFSQFLESIVSRVEGTLGAALMGMDGIPVEKCLPAVSINIESLAAEYSAFLRASSSTTEDAGLGPLEELIISSEQRIAAIRMITPEYFLLILLKRQGNLGRARFELKKARFALAKELAI